MNKKTIMKKLKKTSGDYARYALLTASEAEYSRYGSDTRFKMKLLDNYEEVSCALDKAAVRFMSSPSTYLNDWAIRYLIIQYIPWEDRYKLINEGRIWRVPSTWYR